MIHNYRWRLGVAEGEAEYADLEQRLAEGPVITVPAIMLEGDANGAPHPDSGILYASKFSGSYSHRTIEGGVGHNLPQEAPQAFADAVLDEIYLGGLTASTCKDRRGLRRHPGMASWAAGDAQSSTVEPPLGCRCHKLDRPVVLPRFSGAAPHGGASG